MSDDLKPCPFCGEPPYVDDDPTSTGVTIECCNRKCGVRPSYYIDHEEGQDMTVHAFAAWNERAP